MTGDLSELVSYRFLFWRLFRLGVVLWVYAVGQGSGGGRRSRGGLDYHLPSNSNTYSYLRRRRDRKTSNTGRRSRRKVTRRYHRGRHTKWR